MFDEIVKAIRLGNEDKVINLIKQSTNQDILIDIVTGSTILSYLSEAKMLNASKEAIKKFPYLVFFKNEFNQETILFHTIGVGDLNLAEHIILTSPIAMQQRNMLNETIIHKVIKSKNDKIRDLSINLSNKQTKMLDETTVCWNNNKEKREIEEKYNDFLKLVLSKASGLIDGSDINGNTEMHIAALQGDNQAIIELHKLYNGGLARYNFEKQLPVDIANSIGNLVTADFIKEIRAQSQNNNQTVEYEKILGELLDIYEST